MGNTGCTDLVFINNSHYLSLDILTKHLASNLAGFLLRQIIEKVQGIYATPQSLQMVPHTLKTSGELHTKCRSPIHTTTTQTQVRTDTHIHRDNTLTHFMHYTYKDGN